jgi:hypothetical protein
MSDNNATRTPATRPTEAIVISGRPDPAKVMNATPALADPAGLACPHCLAPLPDLAPDCAAHCGCGRWVGPPVAPVVLT